MDMRSIDFDSLIEHAWAVRENAYVPYSGFAVGAAVLGKNGKIYRGCNVENASYGATCCAERAALVNAISDGQREFRALAVVANTKRPVPPCGVCRQFISEFGTDIPIAMANIRGDKSIVLLSDLLPGSFNRGDMDE